MKNVTQLSFLNLGLAVVVYVTLTCILALITRVGERTYKSSEETYRATPRHAKELQLNSLHRSQFMEIRLCRSWFIWAIEKLRNNAGNFRIGHYFTLIVLFFCQVFITLTTCF